MSMEARVSSIGTIKEDNPLNIRHIASGYAEAICLQCLGDIYLTETRYKCSWETAGNRRPSRHAVHSFTGTSGFFEIDVKYTPPMIRAAPTP